MGWVGFEASFLQKVLEIMDLSATKKAFVTKGEMLGDLLRTIKVLYIRFSFQGNHFQL